MGKGVRENCLISQCSEQVQRTSETWVSLCDLRFAPGWSLYQLDCRYAPQPLSSTAQQCHCKHTHIHKHRLDYCNAMYSEHNADADLLLELGLLVNQPPSYNLSVQNFLDWRHQSNVLHADQSTASKHDVTFRQKTQNHISKFCEIST